MFFKIHKIPTLVKAVGIVTIISALGKILGFVREAIIAAFFGASETTDVFFVANIIPTLLYTTIGISIYSGIIPIYIEEKKKNRFKADQMISVLGTVFFLLASAIALVAFIFSRQLVMIIAPGFSKGQLALATDLTRIMLPSICFLALTAVSTGVLNSDKKFIAPSLTATAQNIVVIVAAILLTNQYGVKGLAFGVLIGTICQFLIQMPQMSQYQIKFNFSLQKEREHIKDTFLLFYPIIIASLSVQLNGITDRMISSGLQQGSISALNYANRLMQLPLSVIMTPLITVLYPSIVENALRGKEKFVEIVLKGVKTIIFLSIPFVVVMVICSKSLIELAFERGAFNSTATSETMIIFIFYSLGLIYFALRDFLMDSLCALKETKLAMYTSLFMVITNVILSLTLSRYIQAAGLALSATISTLVQTLLLAYFLWKRTTPNPDVKKMFKTDMIKLFSTFFLVLVITYPFYFFVRNWSNLIQIIFITALTFSFFIGISTLLKVQESKLVFRIFKKGH